jgi:hypothetical protein
MNYSLTDLNWCSSLQNFILFVVSFALLFNSFSVSTLLDFDAVTIIGLILFFPLKLKFDLNFSFCSYYYQYPYAVINLKLESEPFTILIEFT